MRLPRPGVPVAHPGYSFFCIVHAALPVRPDLTSFHRTALAATTRMMTTTAAQSAQRHAPSQSHRHPRHSGHHHEMHTRRQHRGGNLQQHGSIRESAGSPDVAWRPRRDRQEERQDRRKRSSTQAHRKRSQRPTKQTTPQDPMGHPSRRDTPSSPAKHAPLSTIGIAEAAAVHESLFDDKDESKRAGVGATNAVQSGWDYEHHIDPRTGKTALDVLYDTHLARIRAVLEQPLPALPADGHIDPDFFVGFGHYNYRLRDEYRAVLARALNVPVRAIQLSVAWSGRFSVSHFHRVRYVCGVLLRRGALQTTFSAASSSNRGGGESSADGAPAADRETVSERAPLPSVVRKRVTELIGIINAKQDESLVQMHMTQASHPIPEVEFSLHTREHRLLIRLHTWLQDNLLRTSSVVIVYGGSQFLSAHAAHQSATKRAAMHARGGCCTEGARAAPPHKQQQQHHHGAKERAAPEQSRADSTRTSTTTSVWESAARRDAEQTAQQRMVVEQNWLKTFYTRRVVPRVLSLHEVAYAVADAVRRGELPEMHAPMASCASRDGNTVNDVGNESDGYDRNDSNNEEDKSRDFLLDAPHGRANPVNSCGGDGAHTVGQSESAMRDGQWTSGTKTSAAAVSGPLLPRCISSLMDAEVPMHGDHTAHVSRSAWYSLSIFTQLTAAQQDAAVEWLSLVYRALLFMERRTAALDGSSASGVDASERWVSPNALTQTGLPVFFVHGGLAGGTDQMQYLQHNKHAIDAVLLHPNDVTIKKTIASCVRHGRARLRLYEEAASNYSMD